MCLEEYDDVVPPGKSHDTVLLDFEALKVRIDSVYKTVHVPGDNPEAPWAEPWKSS
jgi:hypothetical protein